MKIYFMGICGTAMGNAALLLKEQGHEVIGADTGVYPPMSDVLGSAGIEVLEGFNPERLASLSPDKVIVGNAMSRGNPEVEWLLDQSEIAYCSLPQLFHESVLPGRFSIVVAGTHGKTTTSALTAFLLHRAGVQPGWLIGGVPNDLPSGSSLGKGEPFVIEGDEYDSAFFDKRSKFIHYRPKVAILNNLEFDHADIFRDLEDVQRSFRHFLRIIPASGFALVNGDDPNIDALLPAGWTEVIRVGCEDTNDLVIKKFSDGPDGSTFQLAWKGEVWASIEWNLHGLFNARNAAMAALAAAIASGHSRGPKGFDIKTLNQFSGVKRRQDVLHSGRDWMILEDFAHHPTAVAGAIEALRAAHPHRKMTVCFEPRSNTAASSRFQSEFLDALTGADRIFLGAVHRAERMAPSERLNTMGMAQDLVARGMSAEAFDCNEILGEKLLELVDGETESGLIVFFTNGAFDSLPKKTADFAASGSRK